MNTLVGPLIAATLVALASVAVITKMNTRRFPELEPGTLSGLPLCIAIVGGLALTQTASDAFALEVWLAGSLFLVVIACNLVNRDGLAAFVENPVRIAMLAVILMTILYTLIPTNLVSNASLLPVWMLLCVLMPLPFSIHRSAKLMQAIAPLNIAYLYCLMILGLVILGMHADFDRESAYGPMATVNEVAAFSLAALLGYRIYVAIAGARAERTRLAANGNVALGLILGWTALQMTSVTARPAVTVVALALILGAPVYASGAYLVFKYLRPYAGKQGGRQLDASWISKHFWFHMGVTVFLIGCGLAMQYSGGHWVVGLVAYVGCFFAYLKILTNLEQDQQRAGAQSYRA